MQQRTIGILIFPDVEELDFVGPLEVFGMAGRLGAPCATVLLAETAEPVRAHYGLTALPDATIAASPALDMLLVPGGPGARGAARTNPAILELVRRQRCLASVCTGALILAEAGALDGRRATTHHAALDMLRAYAKVDVSDDGERYIFDGPVATSAGVSAGIDLALALVARWWGAELARTVARRMEFDSRMLPAADPA